MFTRQSVCVLPSVRPSVSPSLYSSGNSQTFPHILVLKVFYGLAINYNIDISLINMLTALSDDFRPSVRPSVCPPQIVG